MKIDLSKLFKIENIFEGIALMARTVYGQYRPNFIAVNIDKGVFILVLDGESMTLKFEKVEKYARLDKAVTALENLAEKKELQRLYSKSGDDFTGKNLEQAPNYLVCTSDHTLDVDQLFEDIRYIRSEITGCYIYSIFGQSKDFFAKNHVVEYEGKEHKFAKGVLDLDLLFLFARFTKDAINKSKVKFTAHTLDLKQELAEDLERLKEAKDMEKLRPQTKNMIATIAMLVLSFKSFNNKSNIKDASYRPNIGIITNADRRKSNRHYRD